MPKSAKPIKILGTLALIFSLVLLNVGAFFIAIPFYKESGGDISIPEELVASANTIGIIILAVAGVLLIVAIVCLSIYGSQKRRLKKEQERIKAEEADRLMAEERELFNSIMDKYGKYFEVATSAVVELHRQETPGISCKYYLGYDYYKTPSVLTMFVDFYFLDHRYVCDETRHVLLKEMTMALGDLKTDPEIFVLVRAKKSY